MNLVSLQIFDSFLLKLQTLPRIYLHMQASDIYDLLHDLLYVSKFHQHDIGVQEKITFSKHKYIKI